MHHGGDSEFYFNRAREVLKGIPHPSNKLGFPLLLTPFLVIFRPQDQQEILQVVAAFLGDSHVSARAMGADLAG